VWYTCGWTPTYWRVRVEIFLEVAALDILTPLTLVLDGDAAVFPTMMAVDFSPEADRCVALHWCTMLRRWVGIWLKWRSTRNGWCTSHRWHACHRHGARILHGWPMSPLLGWRVHGSDNELVDVVTPLLHRRG
jgi:hypothetical protein